MADTKKQGFRTVSNQDKMEYQRKIQEHRMKVLKQTVIAAIVVLLLVGGTALYMSLRLYVDYDVLVSAERADTKATKFVEFQGNILKYSNDGASYTKHDNEMIWNQTYEMSNPTVDVCGSYVAIYDKKGKDIYILNKNGLLQGIETNYPITQVSIAGQGTIAVLMDNQSKGILNLYDKEGNLLVNGAIHGEKGGYPVAIALSDDAIKLGVTMLDIKEGVVKSTLAFYNFGTVGENAIDHIVSVMTYDDMFISELDFVSKDCMLAIGDTGILVFEGSQTPKESAFVAFEEKVKSVFHNNNYVGIISASNDEAGCDIIRVYDFRGKVVMEESIDITYTNLTLLGSNEVCISERNRCDIYTIRGIHKFHYEFDKELHGVITEGSGLNYTFILSGVTEQVRLK
ncbi:MAG: hypothetical protein IKU69_08070 [Roseburia sp.]|nr:hypothetical protein [Roseburia sp.]